MRTLITEQNIKEIVDILAYLSSVIKMRNASNLTDINLVLEQDFCGLLNLVYGYELISMNDEYNFPVIDLADCERKLAVQVTSQNTRNKIQETINGFIKYELYKQYDRLLIVILGEKKKYKKEFKTCGFFTFSVQLDIIDFKRLVQDISKCEIVRQNKIVHYMKEHFGGLGNSSIKYITDPPSNNCKFYRGRSGEEKDILNWLKTEKSKTYLISGTGGIGKTELAKRIWGYISEYGEEYGIRHLAWVPYSGSDLKLSICQHFLELKYIKNTDAAWAIANDFFSKSGDSLLLFIDNIEKTEHEDRILNSLNQYRFRSVLTTRKPLEENESGKELSSLSLKDCRTLFYKFYKSDKDDASLDSILKKSGRLTVAIELLAKIAEVENMSLKELNRALSEHDFDISNECVSTSHDLLSKEDKIAEQIKKLFSIINCTDEQIRILVKISMFPAKEFSVENVKNWFEEKRITPLEKLVNQGWLRTQENCNGEKRYWMHPVLASSIRMQTSEIAYEVTQPLVSRFTNILGEEKNENLLERFLLMPFAASLQYYMQKYFKNENDVRFMKALGSLYIEMAEYLQAIELFKTATSIVSDKPELIGYMAGLKQELGNAYKQYGNFSEARKYYNSLLKYVEDKISCPIEDKIKILRDMGHLYKSEGNYAIALNYYDKAERVYRQGKRHDLQLSEKYLAIIYYGKGNVYRCAQDFIKSKEYYEKAQSIYQEKVDESSFEWMLIYDNLGVCWFGLGQYDKALEYHEKALKLQSKMYKDIKQPFMGLSYMYRGDVYVAMGEMQAAYDDYMIAADIIQKSVGNMHPYMVRIKNHLAHWFIVLEDYDNAEKNEKEVLAFADTDLGRIHPDTAELYNNLVEIYINKSEKENVLVYHKKLKAYKNTVLHSHPEMLKIWMCEAKYHFAHNDVEKACAKLQILLKEASDITQNAPIVKKAETLLLDWQYRIK